MPGRPRWAMGHVGSRSDHKQDRKAREKLAMLKQQFLNRYNVCILEVQLHLWAKVLAMRWA